MPQLVTLPSPTSMSHARMTSLSNQSLQRHVACGSSNPPLPITPPIPMQMPQQMFLLSSKCTCQYSADPPPENNAPEACRPINVMPMPARLMLVLRTRFCSRELLLTCLPCTHQPHRILHTLRFATAGCQMHSKPSTCTLQAQSVRH